MTEQPQAVREMMVKIRNSIRNIIGKPLFDPASFEEQSAMIRRSMEDFLGKRAPAVDFDIQPDPEHKDKVILTLTARTEAGERWLKEQIARMKDAEVLSS